MLFLFLYDNCTCNKDTMEHRVQLPAAVFIHNSWTFRALASFLQKEEKSFTPEFGDRSQTNAGKRKSSLRVTPACIHLFKGYPKAAQRLYLFVKQHTATLQLNNSYSYASLLKVRRRNFGDQSQTDQFSSNYISCHYAELLAVIFKLPTDILRGQDSLIITHLYIEVLGNFEEQESPLHLQHLFCDTSFYQELFFSLSLRFVIYIYRIRISSECF